MSSAAEGNRLAPIVITPENPFKTDDETLVWTINKSGDNYTISQGENYLSWQGGSTNGATTSTSPYELVITKNKTGNTYQIASEAEPSRILAKNTTATNGFGFYAGTQTKELTLIPAIVDKSPKINITSGTTVNVPSEGDIVTVTYTIKNPNGSPKFRQRQKKVLRGSILSKQVTKERSLSPLMPILDQNEKRR